MNKEQTHLLGIGESLILMEMHQEGKQKLSAFVIYNKKGWLILLGCLCRLAVLVCMKEEDIPHCFCMHC